MKQTAKQAAQEFADMATKYGWRWETRGDILTIKKSFTPNDMDGFRDADMMYYSILECAKRTRAGSDWGTDGGGIGALTAIRHGVFTMNRSGVGKQFMKELEKLAYRPVS